MKISALPWRERLHCVSGKTEAKSYNQPSEIRILKRVSLQGAKQESLPPATAGARAGGSTPQQKMGALALVERKGA